MCSIMLFIACICLGSVKDYHGFGWSFLGSLSTGCAGVYLIWFSLIFVQDADLDEPHEDSFEMEAMELPLPYPHPSPPPFHHGPTFRRNDSHGLLPQSPMPMPMPMPIAPPPPPMMMPIPPAPSSVGSSVGTSERDVYISVDPSWEGSGIDSRDVDARFDNNSNRHNNLNIEMENVALSPYRRRPSGMRLGIDTALQTVKDLTGQEETTTTTDTIPDLTTTASSHSMALDRLTPKSMMQPILPNTNSSTSTGIPNRPVPSSSSNFATDSPHGFEAHTDPDTGRTFYHNYETGVSQWHSPEIQQGLPAGYEAHTDYTTGQTFYVNVDKGTTSWERPTPSIESPPPPPPPPPFSLLTQKGPEQGIALFTPIRRSERTVPLPMGQEAPDMQGPNSLRVPEGVVSDGRISGREGMQQQRPPSKSLIYQQQQQQQQQYPHQYQDHPPSGTQPPPQDSKFLACCDTPCCVIPSCSNGCCGDECIGCDSCGGSSLEDGPQYCTCRSVLSTMVFVFVQFLLWTILFVFAVIPFGFGVQSALQAVEAATYSAPGVWLLLWWWLCVVTNLIH